jgi:hypothetical protein
VGLLRLRRQPDRRALVAQRGQRDPYGGGSLPRDIRRCHAGCQLLLDGARPQQHQQRHAAHCHVRSSTDQKTAQYVDISCATTSASFDDSSEINLTVFR